MDKYVKLGSGEHIYILPELPPKSKILFSAEEKENQYWRRQKDIPQIFFDYNPLTEIDAASTRYDDDGLLVSLSVEDTKTLKFFRDREMDRRTNGIWFMNNGTPVYLTGSYYFALQWGAMLDVYDEDGEPYGKYMEFQRDVFYFLDLVGMDIDCAGGYIIKPKKTGVTQIIALYYADLATRYKGKRMGMGSKTKPDARDTNFVYFKFAIDNLPFIMKPMIGNETLEKMKFSMPRAKSTRSKKSMLNQMDNAKGLNTEVFVGACAEDAYDGPKMFRVWLDEFPKNKNPSPLEMFIKTSESVKLQDEIVGKLILSSYVPEDDSKGYQEGNEVWNDSKTSTRTEAVNRTKSGLYVHFISVLDSTISKIDKYGKCNSAIVNADIEAKIDQIGKDSRALQAFKRQYPRVESDAWAPGGSGVSTFNVARLSSREVEIDAQLRTGVPLYNEYFLDWKNVRLGEVVKIPLEDAEKMAGKQAGVFRFYREHWMPGEEHYNVPVRKKIKGSDGEIAPSLDTLFCGVTDPTDYVQKEHVLKGSKDAITAFIIDCPALNTLHGERVTGRMCVEYLSRHENPLDYYEDVIKLVLYLGMPIYAEANKPWVITKMFEDKLHNFVLFRNAKHKTIEFYNPDQPQVLTTTVKAGTVSTINDYCRAGRIYMKQPQSETDFDTLSFLDSERLIRQLINFDVLDTKIFDAAVCWLLNVLVYETFTATVENARRRAENYVSRDAVIGMAESFGEFFG